MSVGYLTIKRSRDFQEFIRATEFKWTMFKASILEVESTAGVRKSWVPVRVHDNMREVYPSPGTHPLAAAG